MQTYTSMLLHIFYLGQIFLHVRNLAFEQECEDFFISIFKKFLTNSASAWNLKNLSGKWNENRQTLFHKNYGISPSYLIVYTSKCFWGGYFTDVLTTCCWNCLTAYYWIFWTVGAWLRYLDYNRPRRWMLEYELVSLLFHYVKIFNIVKD